MSGEEHDSHGGLQSTPQEAYVALVHTVGSSPFAALALVSEVSDTKLQASDLDPCASHSQPANLSSPQGLNNVIVGDHAELASPRTLLAPSSPHPQSPSRGPQQFSALASDSMMSLGKTFTAPSAPLSPSSAGTKARAGPPPGWSEALGVAKMHQVSRQMGSGKKGEMDHLDCLPKYPCRPPQIRGWVLRLETSDRPACRCPAA